MKIETTITPDMRINEVVSMFPASVRVFHRLGLDACCGGGKTIAEAAGQHGLDVAAVLQELKAEG